MLYRALVGFRIVLGIVLLYMSATTTIAAAVGAATGGPLRLHVIVLAGSEALGALFILMPRTRKVGAVLLVASLGAAFVFHLIDGELRPDLLVYIAGAVLVAAHHASLTSPGKEGP